METRGTTVPIADMKYAERARPADVASRLLTDKEQTEHDVIEKIIDGRKQYEQDRKGKEYEWTESYKMYTSWTDRVLNPYLSNLFIPKTHEAVELLSAFLIGSNQSISASPENGEGNVRKAMVAGKWLDYLWRKVLKARLKILIFIKAGIVFGNGVMNFGYDSKTKKPWMGNCAIEDVYFDYFESNIQESEYLIYEVRRSKDEVKNDSKYDLKDGDGNLIRDNVIVGGNAMDNPATALFNTFDRSLNRSECIGKVLVMEVWCLGYNGGVQRIKTLLPTTQGWRIARDSANPNTYKNGDQFRPFVKLRFKTSPVPNRAYDTGAVWPTVKIQKAFNDLTNEYFDNVVLVNNAMWIKRRGARINPMELVRRPGGVITVKDINQDLKQEQVADVKSSIIEMLNRLDREFQEASMVVNLLKGMSQSDTATGDAIAQDNIQTLLDMIDQNVVDVLSEAGQMILAISISHNDGALQTIELYDNEKETGSLSFDPKNIDGMHDIKIVPDRNSNTNKAVLTKQLLDFLKLIGPDQAINAKYPNLREKVYKYWLDKQGIGDVDYFFEEAPASESPADNKIEGNNITETPQVTGPGVPAYKLPAPKDNLSTMNIMKGINKGATMVQ